MSPKTFHFLSGLPRSGSTVLASILSENPAMYVSATSPLVGVMHGAKHMWDTAEHIKAYSVPGQIEHVMGGIINSFYEHLPHPIVLDKNRAWANPENQEMLRMALGREPKLICTVRPIAPILASFISLIRKNPTSVSFIDQELINSGQALTDKNRCMLLMGAGGHVFQSWSVLKMGYEATPQNMLFLGYDEIIEKPKEVLSKIYRFLDMEPFEHQFTSIVNPVQEDDEKAYKLPGMHAVRSVLKKTSPDPRTILGDELYFHYQGGEFWNQT